MQNNNLISKEKTTQENRIWVRITAACNEKCIFCLDSDAQNGKLIDDDIIKKQIRESYKPWMYNRVIISWGEASIHPKFAHYIAYAKEIWYNHVQTVTNGNMFSRKEFCEKVISAWLDEVTFSLHGHSAKLHDYLTATPGSFEKALKWLIILKKFYPKVIINIDIVVCKVNVDYLPEIVKFYMKLWVYEFDILQIIPFGRWFSEYKNQLFYNVEDKITPLHETWKLSRVPGMYMWTNRFPVEAFEGYEDLIQDPRKIKSETMGEAFWEFSQFIDSKGEIKPSCYGEACDHCFLYQYCHDYEKKFSKKLPEWKKFYFGKDVAPPRDSIRYLVLKGEEFPSDVYKKYGDTAEDFKKIIQEVPVKDYQSFVNIPRCIREDHNKGQYEFYGDTALKKNLGEYTRHYIDNLYRKKSLRCKKCKYNNECEGIHINYIRAYWFQILNPIEE